MDSTGGGWDELAQYEAEYDVIRDVGWCKSVWISKGLLGVGLELLQLGLSGWREREESSSEKETVCPPEVLGLANFPSGQLHIFSVFASFSENWSSFLSHLGNIVRQPNWNTHRDRGLSQRCLDPCRLVNKLLRTEMWCFGLSGQTEYYSAGRVGISRKRAVLGECVECISELIRLGRVAKIGKIARMATNVVKCRSGSEFVARNVQWENSARCVARNVWREIYTEAGNGFFQTSVNRLHWLTRDDCFLYCPRFIIFPYSEIQICGLSLLELALGWIRLQSMACALFLGSALMGAKKSSQKDRVVSWTWLLLLALAPDSGIACPTGQYSRVARDWRASRADRV